MLRHVLAIDAGTTGITAIVYMDGRPAARAYSEFTQHYPAPGHVEHDPLEILRTAEHVGKEALEAAGLRPADVALGITVQRETTVLWQDDRPLHHAIVWQDRRTAARCRELDGERDRIRAKTGLVNDPYFSATKMEWLLRHTGAKTGRLGTIDAWLAHQWTGRHITDETNASRTMLYDIHKSRWDADLLEIFGIPEGMLPEVVPSGGDFGAVQRGPLEGAHLHALVGDQQAALFGQACSRAGQAKSTYGTGCFLLQHTGGQAATSEHGLLTTRAARIDGPSQYALEGSVFIGGAAIQWLRDGLKIIPDAPSVNTRAAESEDNGGVVVVPAFAGLGAPHWDAEARGAILGITRGTSRRHIARATLESIAYQCGDLIDAMEKDSGIRLAALRVDGGATRSDLLMQMQADVLQRPVERPANVETTALGAAWLAGTAAGILDGPPDAGVLTRFVPDRPGAEMVAARRRWDRAVAAVRAF